MSEDREGGTGLKRQIGPVALLFTGITGIVGSGWLFAALYAAQLAGPAAILSWCIGGAVAVLLALVYAELGGMLPVAGAIARIPYYSHCGMSGFMAGWLCRIAYVATAPIEVSAVLQFCCRSACSGLRSSRRSTPPRRARC
jgi:amino acid transporter